MELGKRFFYDVSRTREYVDAEIFQIEWPIVKYIYFFYEPFFTILPLIFTGKVAIGSIN